MSSIHLGPIDFNNAAAFVGIHHRHNKPPVGHKFSIGCYAQAMEIINAAPHEDLPLVIAAMGLLAEDLKKGFDGKDWKPGYVDFLTRIVKDSCETTLISVLVPAEENDDG